MVPYHPRKALQVPKVETAMAIVSQREYLCLQHIGYTWLAFGFGLDPGALILNTSLLRAQVCFPCFQNRLDLSVQSFSSSGGSVLSGFQSRLKQVAFSDPFIASRWPPMRYCACTRLCKQGKCIGNERGGRTQTQVVE